MKVFLLTQIIFFCVVGLNNYVWASLSVAVKPFPVESKLESRVQFWIDVYSKYSKWDLVVHDARFPQVVFEVVNIRRIHFDGKTSSADKKNKVRSLIEEKKNRYLAILKSIELKKNHISINESIFSPEEKKIISLYEGIQEADKFSLGKENTRKIRTQYGLRESFIEGLFESGKYIPEMKKIIEKFGLPEEIVYLPFLESGFDQRALSRVGASGLWQFMPSTGKFFLRVDDVVDERNDPLKAAEGAALLVKENLDFLKEWPLAITAYNHGRAGVLRATKTVKSNSMVKIIEEYKGPNFGFASANYYAAFVAAVFVAKNAKLYFGDMDKAQPLRYEEFVMPEYMDARALTKHVGISMEALKIYNPALSNDVFNGKKYIPVGYTLRIPYSEREQFWVRYKLIPKEDRLISQKINTPTSESKANIPLAHENQL